MKFKISSIRINNFFSFKEAEFRNLKGYNVLIGKNNAGKSNLFKLLDTFIDVFDGKGVNKNVLFNENEELSASLSLSFKLSKDYRNEIFNILNNEGEFSNAFSGPQDCPKTWNDDTLKWLIEQGFCYKFELKFKYYKRWQTLILSGLNFYHKDYSEASQLYSLNEERPSKLKYDLIDKVYFHEKENLRDYFLTSLPPKEPLPLFETSKDYQDPKLQAIFNRILDNMRNKSSDNYNPLLFNVLNDLISLLKNDFIHHIPDFRKFVRSNDIENLERAIILPDGSNLSKFLAHKKVNEAEWLDEINTEIIEFFEEIEEFSAKIEENSTILHSKEKGMDCIFRLENLGAGVLNIVLFLIYLKYLNQDRIILFEEPELFIYPGLQKKVREKLLAFSVLNQVFITTHSPNFLTRNFKKCSIYKVQKKDNHSIIAYISGNNLLSIFKELNLSFYDYILYDGILFVEGQKDIEVFKVINEELFEKNFKLIPTEGKNNFIHYASANIIEFLDNNLVNFLFILDRDRGNEDFYKRIEVDMNRKLVKERIIPLFTYEIENIFLQPILILDYLYTYKKTKDIKEDYKWLLDTLENIFQLFGINNFEYILKKLNDDLYPRLSKQEIKEILNNNYDLADSGDFFDYIYEKINSLFKDKLHFFKDPQLNREDIYDKLKSIQNQYNELFERKEYNLILSGKKVFKKFSNEIINKYKLGDFSLETLTRHLISYLYDYNNFISENIIIEKKNEHPLLDDGLISKFRGYINNILGILDEIQKKTDTKLNIQIRIKLLKNYVLRAFIINRWNLDNPS